MNDFVKSQIEFAVRQTPSGDNSQPFSCRWIGTELHVHHDENRASHRLNHGHFASLLALGCLLENVRVMAIGLGYSLVSDTSTTDPLKYCVLRFSEAAEDKRLLSAVSARVTDRRIFHQGWDESLLSGLITDTVSVIPFLPDDVRKFFLACDGIFWDDPDVFFDIFKWIRFTKKEACKMRDGLPADNLGLSFTDKLALWIAGRGVFAHKILGLAGGKFLGKKLFSHQLDSAAGFVFIKSESPSPMGIVEAGKAGMRVWLELTNKGLGVQPLTMGTLMPYVARHFSLHPQFQPGVKELLEQGAIVMENELELPVWGFRFGKVSTPLPEASRTYRR